MTCRLAVLPDNQGWFAILLWAPNLTHRPPVSLLRLTAHLRNHHLKSKEAWPHFLDGPLPESNWWLKCAREKRHQHLVRLHFLITFTGPQSHPRNHGDTDKVTHDYSSAVLPDWTAPKSLAKRIHQRSLCPYSTSVQPSSWCQGCKVPSFSSSGSDLTSEFPFTCLEMPLSHRQIWQSAAHCALENIALL